MMFKYEMHFHTKCVSPCGQVVVEEAVDLYREAGYDGLVVTDHFNENFFAGKIGFTWREKIDRFLAGYHRASSYVRGEDFRVFLGLEITFTETEGDFLLYGADEQFLKRNKCFHQGSLGDFRELMDESEKKLLLFQAHPFRDRPAAPELLDGMEIFNGNARHDNRNQQAKEFAARHGLLVTAGSDFHQKEDLARAGIVTEKKLTGNPDLLSVLSGRVLEIYVSSAEEIERLKEIYSESCF